tara:strand:+ start:1859 stop:2644 length:786 start_codon:yes stop_codon:yes gene_type:complete
MSAKRHAFSLVELSIVLVILGLLTGGILTGQSLIRAAELRSVVVDFQKYQTAIRGFQGKYFSLPGDMRNATSFWGAQTTCPGTNTTVTTPVIPTCNGNGNGEVGRSNGSANADDAEVFLVWQHLANSGLIEGSYTGVTAHSDVITTPPRFAMGVNIPNSKLTNGSFSFYHRNPPSGAADFPRNANQLLVANRVGSTTTGVITGEEAWNLDTKMDDGKPGQGAIMGSSFAQTPACSTTNDAATSAYILNNSAKDCYLYLLFK